MLQVLGRTSSINVRKVLWTCAELDLEFESIEWGAGALSLQSPEFLTLNPLAMVPVIRDGDFVLRESNTICRYLAARQQRADLLPTSAAQRARVEQWMDWQASELNNAWRYAFMALVRRSAAHADAEAIAASVAQWNRQMGILDAALADSPYVTGETFTLADVVLGLATHRWYSTPMERPPLDAVARYYERLSERAGFMRFGRNGQP